jgi:SHAQKYF class myb-like DNA-binding protein
VTQLTELFFVRSTSSIIIITPRAPCHTDAKCATVSPSTAAALAAVPSGLISYRMDSRPHGDLQSSKGQRRVSSRTEEQPSRADHPQSERPPEEDLATADRQTSKPAQVSPSASVARPDPRAGYFPSGPHYLSPENPAAYPRGPPPPFQTPQESYLALGPHASTSFYAHPTDQRHATPYPLYHHQPTVPGQQPVITPLHPHVPEQDHWARVPPYVFASAQGQHVGPALHAVDASMASPFPPPTLPYPQPGSASAQRHSVAQVAPHPHGPHPSYLFYYDRQSPAHLSHHPQPLLTPQLSPAPTLVAPPAPSVASRYGFLQSIHGAHEYQPDAYSMHQHQIPVRVLQPPPAQHAISPLAHYPPPSAHFFGTAPPLPYPQMAHVPQTTIPRYHSIYGIPHDVAQEQSLAALGNRSTARDVSVLDNQRIQASAPPPVIPSLAVEHATKSGNENSRTVSSSGTLRGGVEKGMDSTANSSSGTASTGRKKRLQWTPSLHARFVKAVEEIGIDIAVPKVILQRMGAHGLTRENVASHLQKYREAVKKSAGAVNPRENEDNGDEFTTPQSIENAADKDAVSGPTNSVDHSNDSWKDEKQENNCDQLPTPIQAIESMKAAGSGVEDRHRGTGIQEPGTTNFDSSNPTVSPEVNKEISASSNRRTHDEDR